MPHTIRVVYCTQCAWMLRAAWVAQELLTTFQDELMGGGATLVPGTGGIFEVYADDERVWSRKSDGGFPDIVELKRRVRDRIAPDRVLGHADRAARASSQPRPSEGDASTVAPQPDSDAGYPQPD